MGTTVGEVGVFDQFRPVPPLDVTAVCFGARKCVRKGMFEKAASVGSLLSSRLCARGVYDVFKVI